MPTKKPRIAVTLPQHVYDTIERLAALQGVSRGFVVADMLESVHPPLMRTVALLEAARDAPKRVKLGLKQTLEELERDIGGDYTDALAQMDWLAARLGGSSAGGGPVRGEGPAAAPEAEANPQVVTRGSGGQPPTPEHASKPPRKPTRSKG